MKSFLSLFSFLCIVVISSAILPVEPPIAIDPPPLIVDPPPPVEPCSTDVCSLPSVTGPCKAAMRKYFFNKATGSCELFTYGGCGGNGNNFETIEQCLAKCKPDVCSLPPVTGMCMALFRRYFFNKKSGKCELFTYGGCGGNGNNFETEEQCLAKCKPGATVVCSLPSVTGPCKAAMMKYFFNKSTGTCELFVYGGCGGNGNNFETKEQCSAKCGKVTEPPVKDVCSLPSVTGLCRGFFQKYFYNKATGSCETFIYGGCGGNGNNFDTKEQCLARCGKPQCGKPQCGMEIFVNH